MRRNNIVFLIILAITIFAALVAIPLDKGILFNRPVKQGLDLVGGVRLIYQADMTNVAAADQKAYMDADVGVIYKRVNSLGATEPVVQVRSGNTMLVEIPSLKDPKQATDLIGRVALLEFAEQCTADDPLVNSAWTQGNQHWKPAMGTLNTQQVALTSAYFKNNTSITTDSKGALLLTFEWNNDGSVLSQEITTRLYNNNHALLGIFSGTQLVSSPSVNGIISDKGEIEGLSQAEATSLRDMLNAGRLQVPLTLVSNEIVDSTMGSQFFDLAVKAGLIGLLLVMVFMIIYYRLPGLMASLALVFYAAINLAIFKLLNITMTLGGIAGFVASIGMAVDANVLIFERMKEELRAGRTVGAAIEAGFNRAWAAILDCHVTNLIAAIIMYILGSSSLASGSLITGFALTLFIGVALSLISAIIVTRTFLRLFVGTPVAQSVALFRTIGGK